VAGGGAPGGVRLISQNLVHSHFQLLPNISPAICARTEESTRYSKRTQSTHTISKLSHTVMAKFLYRYSPLPLGFDIRLLRLMPHKDRTAPIQCQLFDYSLQESDKRTHPYDALSYAWGSSDKLQSISIGEHDLQNNLPVTKNLHEALSRLRHRSIERIVWVDAVCINQADEQEKMQQIQLMAKIYAQANCVVVWLGEPADNSDRALEAIRVAGAEGSTNSLNNDMIQQSIIALLDRPWFRRIWVSEQGFNGTGRSY
jgi:hypothetical protein